MPCARGLVDFKAASSAGCGLLSVFDEAKGNLRRLTSPPAVTGHRADNLPMGLSLAGVAVTSAPQQRSHTGGLATALMWRFVFGCKHTPGALHSPWSCAVSCPDPSLSHPLRRYGDREHRRSATLKPPGSAHATHRRLCFILRKAWRVKCRVLWRNHTKVPQGTKREKQPRERESGGKQSRSNIKKNKNRKGNVFYFVHLVAYKYRVWSVTHCCPSL